MKRSGLSMAAMVATVVMVLTVSTYAITARTVNPVVGLSFQGTTAVCHAKCFAGSDNDNIQATLGRDFFDRSGWSNTVIVGIDLLTDTSVDRQIRHCYAAIENIDLAQCFLFRRCCESGGREHTKKHDDG